MSESTLTTHVSAHTSLAALGCLLCHKHLLAPLEQQVRIAQKTVKYTPIQKVQMALVLLLSGAHRLVEVNTRLRPDTGLLAAFGLEACAEQSVIQETLSACTEENVQQLQQALDSIYRKHSRGFAHDYQTDWQLVDIDLSGLPAGREAEGSKKGYFHGSHGQRGRQTGRVIATRYDEIVVERVYPGDTNLMPVFLELVAAAEQTLQLTSQQKARTILRVDGGAGSLHNINACLEAGYHYHGKDYSSKRVTCLVPSVIEWYDDPHFGGRQVGLITAAATDYVRPVTRIALRHLDRKGQWQYEVLLCSLPAAEMLLLCPPENTALPPEARLLLSYVYFYDARGGGIECALRQDNQGLGRTCRNKKRLCAQQMLACLGALAHNILIWARHWFQPGIPRLGKYGLLRLTRDVFGMSGCILLDAGHQVSQIVLPRRHPLAQAFCQAWQLFYHDLPMEVNLGEI
jgi:hypothetical protein